MKKMVVYGLMLSILLLGMASADQSENNLMPVNLLVNIDMVESPTEEQVFEAEGNLLNLMHELQNKKLKATFSSPYDVIATRIRLRITEAGRDPNFELAMSGNNSHEKLSMKSYAEQESILTRSKQATENARVCGTNEIVANGFMPQSFDQSQDTYKVLDELGIQYDAGFQAGLLYAPGHENDVWPYQLEGYNFYAVPVSTYILSDKRVPLHDKYFQENGLTSSQWSDALENKFIEAKENGEPVVIALTTSVSGNGDYLNVLKEFLDFAVSKDASFVTTLDLVNMSLEEGYVPKTDVNGGCATCGQKGEEEGSISVGITALQSNNTTEAATADLNSSSSN